MSKTEMKTNSTWSERPVECDARTCRRMLVADCIEEIKQVFAPRVISSVDRLLLDSASNAAQLTAVMRALLAEESKQPCFEVDGHTLTAHGLRAVRGMPLVAMVLFDLPKGSKLHAISKNCSLVAPLNRTTVLWWQLSSRHSSLTHALDQNMQELNVWLAGTQYAPLGEEREDDAVVAMLKRQSDMRGSAGVGARDALMAFFDIEATRLLRDADIERE